MEHTQSYVRFMMECKGSYEDLCDRIDEGSVPAGCTAKVTIEVPRVVVDAIRFDRIAASAE